MVDVVIPVGIGSKYKDHWELRYTLRSILEHFMDLRDVWIVGYRPEWLQNVNYIDCDDPFTKSKDSNLIRKILRVCEEEQLSQRFIRMSDDQLFLTDLKINDLKPVYVPNGDRLMDLPKPGNRFLLRLKNTKSVLLKQGLSKVYNYESHLPMVYDKSLFTQILNKYNWGDHPGFTINSIYFNNLDIERIPRDDKTKATYETYHSYTKEQLKEQLKDKLFLGYNDRGLSNDLQAVIEDIFPFKSPFEK